MNPIALETVALAAGDVDDSVAPEELRLELGQWKQAQTRAGGDEPLSSRSASVAVIPATTEVDEGNELQYVATRRCE